VCFRGPPRSLRLCVNFRTRITQNAENAEAASQISVINSLLHLMDGHFRALRLP